MPLPERKKNITRKKKKSNNKRTKNKKNKQNVSLNVTTVPIINGMLGTIPETLIKSLGKM